LNCRRGPLSPRPAQLGTSLGPISRAKLAAPSASSGHCQAGPNASQTPPVSLTSLWAGNRYTPDPLSCPISSPNPSPSSAPTDLHCRRDFGQIRDASVRPRLPHAAPSHPLAVDHRLKAEPSRRVVVRRCAAVMCRSTPPLHSPQCRGQAPATRLCAAPLLPPPLLALRASPSSPPAT
jgi:hypothetical protein